MPGNILDFLTNNWDQILGISPSANLTNSGVNPGTAATGMPSYSPSGVMDANPITGQPPTVPPQGAQGPAPNMPADWSSFPNVAGAQDPSGRISGAPMAAATPPSAPPPTPGGNAVPSLTSANYGPSPNDAFGSMSGGNPALARAYGPPGAPALPPNAAPVAGPAPGGAPMPNGLAQQLGATTTLPTANPVSPWRTAAASLGAGMSAVGAQRPGANAGASFAAGLGGSLTGGLNYEDKQKEQNFNQSSTAFRDMLAAQNQDDTERYRQAQAAYLSSRAQAINSGGTGSNAWQSTPYGKMIQVENEAQKYEKGQQIILQKRWALNGATPDQQQTDLDNLQRNTEAYRQRLYKSAGISPDQGAQMKDWGTAPDKPFQTKGMTLDQFNQQVPMGAWYLDQNGVARQRMVPPPTANATGGSASAQDGAANYTADMMALQPAQQALAQ